MTMEDDDRRTRLISKIANIALQIAEAESLAVGLADDQTLLGASNELAQLRQMLKDLESKIRTDQSRKP
jgi:hypothetical protein